MKKFKTPLMIAVGVLLLFFAGTTIYLYSENQDLKDQATLTTEEKNRQLVAEINDVFDLPDEEPVVAIVTNPDEFKAEYSSFDNAEEGDYLLFFRKARLNVLYRQSEKRVVKTADVVVPISVEVVGSQKALDSAESALADFGNQITVITKIDDTVSQAFVFDIDGDQGAEAQSITDQLGLSIGSTLPTSFTPDPQSEIVVFVVDSSATPAEPAQP